MEKILLIFSFLIIITSNVFGGGVSFTQYCIPKDIPYSEYLALIAFYEATGGTDWTNGGSTDGTDADAWGYSANADDWYGVTVGGGHVTGLDLNANNLVGDFATTLTAFDAVMTGAFDLSGNASLTGGIADCPAAITGNFAIDNTGIDGDLADGPTGLAGNILANDSGISTYTPSGGVWPYATGNTKTLDFDDLSLSQADVDALLVDLAAKSNTGCTLDLTGNAQPTSWSSINTLLGRGWTVSVTESLGSEKHTLSNAAMPSASDSNSTTGWASNCTFTSDATPALGTWALKGVATIVNSRFYVFLKDDGLNLLQGSWYKITFQCRHAGTGGDWIIGLNDSSTSTIHIPYATLTSAHTTYQSIVAYFIFNNSGSGTDTDTFMAREYNVPNDGGAFIDNVSIKRIVP